jgi:hypothetical protein
MMVLSLRGEMDFLGEMDVFGKMERMDIKFLMKVKSN